MSPDESVLLLPKLDSVAAFSPKLLHNTFFHQTQRLGIFDEDRSVAMLKPCCRLHQWPLPWCLLLLLLPCLLSASYSQQEHTGQHGEKRRGGGRWRGWRRSRRGGGRGWWGRGHCEQALQLWSLWGFANSFPQVFNKQQLILHFHHFPGIRLILLELPWVTSFKWQIIPSLDSISLKRARCVCHTWDNFIKKALWLSRWLTFSLPLSLVSGASRQVTCLNISLSAFNWRKMHGHLFLFCLSQCYQG